MHPNTIELFSETIAKTVTAGEILQVRDQLPAEVRELRELAA